MDSFIQTWYNKNRDTTTNNGDYAIGGSGVPRDGEMHGWV